MNPKLYILVVVMIGTTLIASCHSNDQKHIAEESKQVAEENNEDKFNSNSAEKDAQMVVNLAAWEYEQIELAKTAKRKTANRTIKNIATTLLADHMMMMKQLREYAVNHTISIPDSITAADRQHARKMAENNTPTEFDKQWVKDLLDKHEKLIAAMEDGATTAGDPDLRAWINDALPKIRVHRDKLMQIKYTLR